MGSSATATALCGGAPSPFAVKGRELVKLVMSLPVSRLSCVLMAIKGSG
jgi:hypothetical protein